MATHERQLIREAVVARLMGKTAAGPNVFPTRNVPWRRVELPGISVFTMSEDREPYSSSVDKRRVLTMAVLLIVSLDEKVDDAIDALSLEVEDLISADPTLGGVVHSSWYTGAQIETSDEYRQPVAAARLTFAVEYFPRR